MNVVCHRRRREAGFGETRPDEICTRRKWSLDTASVCEAASDQIISRSKRQTRFGMNVVTAGQCLLSRLTDQRGIQQKQKLSRTTFLRQQSGSPRRVEVHLLPTRPRQKSSHFAPMNRLRRDAPRRLRATHPPPMQNALQHHSQHYRPPQHTQRRLRQPTLERCHSHEFGSRELAAGR